MVSQSKRKPIMTLRPTMQKRVIAALKAIIILPQAGIALYILGLIAFSNAFGFIGLCLSLFFGIIFLLTLSVSLHLIDDIFFRKVIIEEEGIWVIRGPASFFTWDDLHRFNTLYGRPSDDWGIETDDPSVVERAPFLRRILRFWKPRNFIPLSDKINIPKQSKHIYDIESFQQTELGRLLYQHAPHLFSDDQLRKPKNDLNEDDVEYYAEDSQMSDEQYG